MNNKSKDKKSNIFLILIFVIGLCLLLYPSFSDYWNSFHSTRAIASYEEAIHQMDRSQFEKMKKEAEEYNENLVGKKDRYVLSDEELYEYHRILDVSGTGIMAYIDIPDIKISLPIYHSVDESILQIAVGHIPGTSFPVGGESTHCVLSGHRGLPSAKLFTDIDQLTEGDIFMMHVLDETLTYEVDQIRIVLPDEMKDLEIKEKEDYCTLVTCTPYGVNSHRLLVRGHRIENIEDYSDIRVTADALQIDPMLVAPILAVPILFVLIIGVLVYSKKRK